MTDEQRENDNKEDRFKNSFKYSEIHREVGYNSKLILVVIKLCLLQHWTNKEQTD